MPLDVHDMTRPASSAHYPSLNELLEAYSDRIPLPPELRVELRQRYDKHGWEYVTMEKHGDRYVNACMNADSLEDAREELVDAVFNLLVANFKKEKGDRKSWVPEVALGHVLQAMAILTRASAKPNSSDSS